VNEWKFFLIFNKTWEIFFRQLVSYEMRVRLDNENGTSHTISTLIMLSSNAFYAEKIS